MSSTLTNHYRSGETFSAVVVFNEELHDKHRNNPVVVTLGNILQSKETEMRASIAFHEQDSLAREADAVDAEFNEGFMIFSGMAESDGKAKHLGGRFAVAAEINDVIIRHGKDLHRKPKDEQINYFDGVVEACAPLVEKADMAEIFAPVVDSHLRLKDIQRTRKAGAEVGNQVKAPSEIAKEVTPLLNKLYENITVLAELDVEEYADTLNAINTGLAPIVTRVKSRLTKRKNSEEE